MKSILHDECTKTNTFLYRLIASIKKYDGFGYWNTLDRRTKFVGSTRAPSCGIVDAARLLAIVRGVTEGEDRGEMTRSREREGLHEGPSRVRRTSTGGNR